MSSKKWLVMFPCAVALAVLTVALFNILVDPFGIFGDPIYDWYSYDETNNPRIAKVRWLEDHPEDYDSFILGSSSAASYDPEQLNGYLDASFYNLFAYGADTKDYRDMTKYLLENYRVKNIVLNLGINECFNYDVGEDTMNNRMHAKVTGGSLLAFTLKFALTTTQNSIEKVLSRPRDTELPQAFDVFVPETGVYDKRVRDTEPIGDLAAYESIYAADFAFSTAVREMPHIDECLASVREISDMCRKAGVNLIVVVNPEYIARWNSVSEASMRRFREGLAQITDYWDFALSSLSLDSRYYYDVDHFRNAAGTMAMARIFSDPEVYVPEDYGAFVTEETVDAYLDRLFSEPPQARMEDYTRTLPILMYHHLEEDPATSANVSPETFEAHLKLLLEHGYTPVSLREMEDFVTRGGELPEKPVLITFDDGYESNYELAFPILQKYGAKAVIFPIGVSVGKTLYKDTDYVMTPHFGFDEMREMVSSGLVEIGSHTWDMHQWPPFESGDGVRENILPLSGESEEDYLAALRADLAQYDAVIRRELGQEGFLALAYPSGQYNTLSEVVLYENAIPITLTVRTDRPNVLIRGLPQSLRALSRWSVDNATTPEELLKILGA